MKRKKICDKVSCNQRQNLLNDDTMKAKNNTYETQGRNKKLAALLRFKDAELTRDQKWRVDNVCKKCNCVLTTQLTCMNDCE